MAAPAAKRTKEGKVSLVRVHPWDSSNVTMELMSGPPVRVNIHFRGSTHGFYAHITEHELSIREDHLEETLLLEIGGEGFSPFEDGYERLVLTFVDGKLAQHQSEVDYLREALAKAEK